MSAPAEPLPLDPTKLVVATLSDAGRARPDNQDAATVLANVSNERLLVVADGMGGQRGGETAAKLCLDTLGRVFRDPHGTPEERLRRGLELANEEVYSHALSNPEHKGMGTTAVALLFSAADRGVWLAWVGDSRCYRLRDGALEALTRDHSLMAEWVAMGVIRPDEAANHPRRNELTRGIGQAPDVSVEVVRVDVRPGDRFLLCSDGIHSPVPERALKAAFATGSPEEAAHALVERANASGGPDNATAIVVDLPPEAFHEGAIEQLPEVPLELELPSPPPPPEPPPVTAAEVTPPAAPAPLDLEPPQSEVFGMDLEPTSHSSAAIDAALAELESARLSVSSAPSSEDSGASLPQMFEPATPTPARARVTPTPPPSFEDSMASLPEMFDLATAKPEEPEPQAPAPPPPAPPVTSRAEELAGETSFADLMDEGPAELTPPPEVTAPPPAAPSRPVTPPAARELDFGAPAPLDSPSLVAAPAPRAIRIPLMTPVRKRRGLHAASLLTGLAAGVFVVAVAGGAWLYLGQLRTETHSTASAAPPPQRPAARPTPPPAPRVTPPPMPEPAPTPAPEPVAREVTPPTAPTAEVTPPPAAPAPAPEPQAAVTPPAPSEPVPPAPIAMPSAPHPAPTTVVIVRPPGPTPTVTVPAAPDGSAVAPPVPTAAGFELSPPVRRFVDDWLRAQETHDSALFQSLGFPVLPTELAGTWTTRDGYRLVAASIDEERSTPERVYLRLVVSYAFRDGSGRFRTEDEERMILSSAGGSLRFEGRWQQ